MSTVTIPEALRQALALHEAGRLPEAETIYRQVLAVEPANGEAWHLLGVLASQTGRHQEAAELMVRSIALCPGRRQFHNNLGETYRDLGRLDEAVAQYRLALALEADYPEAHSNAANVLIQCGHPEEGLHHAERAIALRPHYPEAWHNLGKALQATGRPAAAIAPYERALALRPEYLEARNNLGNALKELGMPSEAIPHYEEVLARDPERADVHFNLSLTLLTQGDFARGWQEYEWRLKIPALAGAGPTFREPRWAGEEISGQTILIHTEQGFGDMLQMVRYVPQVAARGAKVLLLAPAVLRELLAGVEGATDCQSRFDALPAFELHCPMMSLPRIFGTLPETIPATVPYLQAPAEKLTRWRARVRTQEGNLNVGLVWAGRDVHTDDRWRTMTLAALAPVLGVEGVRFISLQKGPAAAQAADNPGIYDWSADLHDFGDTAALIANLDLVISVETAVAHLAGALATPVWTLMPFVAPWQWTVRGEKSLWYPTMRVFQQDALGDWSGAVERLATALRQQVASK